MTTYIKKKTIFLIRAVRHGLAVKVNGVMELKSNYCCSQFKFSKFSDFSENRKMYLYDFKILYGRRYLVAIKCTPQ